MLKWISWSSAVPCIMFSRSRSKVAIMECWAFVREARGTFFGRCLGTRFRSLRVIKVCKRREWDSTVVLVISSVQLAYSRRSMTYRFHLIIRFLLDIRLEFILICFLVLHLIFLPIHNGRAISHLCCSLSNFWHRGS